ncbi:hypothetical protein Mesop_3487 [Mesorhizobium opportunistum WSM2075]|uniref:Uncharacterized protein n=1 Tax=Mesorhizobium opportunistum (strain LMG 24607 / HAMBI 3007 / WSM2075) TaxID=536019 RepID=F7YEQ0_MESOW|nr:hypothetical protein Mesop_3487 [Mesorhizobium opportunistum WSM2075]
MMIEGSEERAAQRAFVILGRSKREAACADPRIRAATLAEKCKRLRILAKQSEAQVAMFRTAAERRGSGMDPRVCAASLRSLLRPRMTKRKAPGLRFAPATLSPAGRGEGER